MIGDKPVNEGELLEFTISATDPDGDSLTYSASNLPSGASFDPSTQTFSWTPAQAGTYAGIHFEVSDGELTDSEDMTITVSTVSPPSGGGGGGGGGADRMPPRISDISTSNIPKTTADIYWSTHEKSDSQVEYWASESKFSPLAEGMVTKHVAHLTDLTPGTSYSFKVMSKDKAGNLAVSDEYTFTTQGAPATFAVSALDITPAEVDIGEEVTISVVVANTGDAAGSYGVTLKIDGVVEATKEVTIDAGASQVVSFTIIRDDVGLHTVDANGMTSSFTVNEQPSLEISVFNVTPHYDTETHRLTFAEVTYEINNLYEPMADAALILEVGLDNGLLEEVSLLSTSQLELGGTTGSRDYIAPEGWKSGTYTFQAKLYVGGESYTTMMGEELEVTPESAVAVVSWAILAKIIGAALAFIAATTSVILLRRRHFLRPAQQQQDRRQEALFGELNKAVKQGFITQDKATQIKNQWEQQPEYLRLYLYQYILSFITYKR